MSARKLDFGQLELHIPIAPTAGFTATPIIPLPIPLKNPCAPSFCAPFIGSSTIPVIPFSTPKLRNSKLGKLSPTQNL